MGRKPINAGVVVVTKFVDKKLCKDKKLVASFKGYVNYIDRNEAVRNENYSKYDLFSQDRFKNYTDYIGNPDKTGGIFTDGCDQINAQQKQSLKEIFQKAYDNDSIMWQTVVSFDNRYLTKLGIYDPVTGVLDEKVLQDSIRRMMRNVFKNEKIENSAIWSAAIHYNTDNIHIHIAYTEPVSTRPVVEVDGMKRSKGFFSAKTMRSMKSDMVNSMLGINYTVLDEYIRSKFVGSKRQHLTMEDRALRNLWFRIYDNLPQDKRQWFYNMNGINNLRPLIDSLTQEYISNYHGADYTEFLKQLYRQQDIYQEAYGKNSKYKDYAANKIKDLYARMGNTILAEMREYSRYGFEKNFAGNTEKDKQIRYNQTGAVIGKLKHALNRAYGDNEAQNMQEYYKLQRDISRELNV